MLEKNKSITYSGERIIDALKEVELILISLHKMGSYFGEKFLEDGEAQHRAEYEKETTHFIDDWKVANRLATIRTILSEKFDDTLGEDDMDDIERAMEGIKY
ncbi:hypothetical protein WAK64_14165 [Bacillus spongiae]|uniref:Uncharacterized protein n=1 Tax=Bacillus spongiae TaxID=2683610 RepID=A0ABU8HFP7_9BACI